MVQITGLFVYPVKSCRGISLEQVELGPRGFLHDREFLVVDGTGSFLTQRTVPELAMVRIALSNSDLILNHATVGELRVPFDNVEKRRGAGAPRKVRIFNDEVLADDVGDEAAEWFTAVLQQTCRLVQTGASYVRRVPPDAIAPAHRPSQGPEISFTDAFPTLLISEASLADLNARLPKPLPMDRFRPNIVVRGCGPYEEDSWSTIRVGNVVFGCATPNLRCVITTIDQQTGRRDGSEPLRTLATYRRAPDASGVMFGQYLVHSGTGKLCIGDALEVESVQPIEKNSLK